MKPKSSNLDEIPVYVIRKLSNVLSPILSTVINFSLVSGKFPTFLKTARVVPLHKSGDPEDLINYRHISIFNNFSKIHERVVHSQLLSYFSQKDIFFKHQYGFRPNKSIPQAVLHLLHNIYSSLDDDNLYFTMFLDLRKAFDCASHEILLDKLYFYGIRGITHDWFRSYLTQRKQYVSTNGTNVRSSCENFEYGVPQGSILGPLFFYIGQ